MPSELGPPQQTPWLTKRDAAERAQMSVRSIEQAMREGELRYSGGRTRGMAVRIHITWLDEWLATRGTGIVTLMLALVW